MIRLSSVRAQEIKSLVKVLTKENTSWGPQTPVSFREVLLVIFKANKSFEGELIPAYLKEIKKICLRIQNWQEIATIIEAVTAYMPHHSHKWLLTIVDPVSLNREPEEEQALKRNPHFILGLSLGLFRSSYWLDQNWRAKEPFYEEMCEWVPELILWHDELTAKADSLLPDPAFESQLSQVIKAFLRTDVPWFGARGIRMSWIIKIIESCLRHLTGQGKKIPLARISALILEQLSYTFFGQMAEWAKLQSLYLAFPGLKMTGKKARFLSQNLAESNFADLTAQLSATDSHELEKAIAQNAKHYLETSDFALLWKIPELANKNYVKDLKDRHEWSQPALELLNLLAYEIFKLIDIHDKAQASIKLMQHQFAGIAAISGKRQIRRQDQINA